MNHKTAIDIAQEDFSMMAGHKLKTPVTSIKAYTQILQRKCEKNGEEESVIFLRKIDEQLVRLTNTINTLYT